MQRIVLVSALLTSVLACSYSFEASTRVEADPLTLDELTPTRSFNVRVCWEGDAEVDSVSVQVLAADPEFGSGRASVEIAGEVTPIGMQRPDEIDAPAHLWMSDEIDDACEIGTTISFTLADLTAGAAELEWSVIGTVGSGIDEAVEKLDPVVTIEPL